MFQLLAFQTGVLYGNACIAEFAAAVAVKEIETSGDAEVQPEVAAAAVGGNIIFVAVSYTHLDVYKRQRPVRMWMMEPCLPVAL